MSLPVPWVERIFDKLTVRYGRDFIGRWEGVNITAVKQDWADELARFQQNPDAIRYGLDNLPIGKPPTVAEFAAICNGRPEAVPRALPSPKADPERVAQAIQGVRKAISQSEPKSWAWRLKAREDSGEKLTQAQRDMWRSVVLPRLASEEV
jgi:hypothetical protein